MMIEFVSDSALQITFPGEISREMSAGIHGLTAQLQSDLAGKEINFHPAFCSLLVEFEPRRERPGDMKDAVERALKSLGKVKPPVGRRVVIPTRYDGEDLREVAARAGLSVEEAAELHSSVDYTVAFLGFAPNFPYLLGLPGPLHGPRKKTARTVVPAGSVAVAGPVCGIYPEETPGGWQLIGTANPDFQFQPGDKVRFVATHDLPVSKAVKAAPRASIIGWVACEAGAPLVSEQAAAQHGRTHLGISPGGAADPRALFEANRLVGNSFEESALEIAAIGEVDLTFLQETWFSVTGAECSPRLDQMPIQMWSSLPVSAGQRLRLNPAQHNFRSYVGIHQNRGAAEFRKSDILMREPYAAGQTELRVTRGPQWEWFSQLARERIFAEEFKVTAELSRKGVRLSGSGLRYGEKFLDREMTSEGIANGAIQVMPDGQPVILFCEQRTTGGYPKIANVINADLYKIGQLRPGQALRLREVSMEDAWALLT